MSPYFRDHPTGRVVVDFISQHNKEDFEIFCFSLIADMPEDQIQNKIKESSDHYISLYNVSIAAAAKQIHDQQIDILIDLAGYTTHSRTEILALQPAPIQCQMIGFPGTMGADFIQYIIADDLLVPKDHELLYTESVLRLPYGFPGSILEVNEEKQSRKDFGLPEDAFIYCCFNSQYKYSPEVFDTWMEILKNVPDGILLLKGGSDTYKNNILSETQKRDIDSARIIFAENLPFPDYMARNKVCDLFLDTFFYTAGSTAINVLQTGLPVLTFAGKTNASRMGASIVNATNLKEFICDSTDAYKEKAIYLGNNPASLNQIKDDCKQEILDSDLFNSKKYTLNLERGFTKMWEDYLMGKKPESINI
jgi:predicted O-linked N-acetylglucosamine transferase (SPINDLY family)